MKQLTLVRHAHSLASTELSDFERPLSEQGLTEARQVAQQLADVLRTPDRILTSGALRALTTAQIFAQALAYPEEEIDVLADIYSGYDSTLINLLEAYPDRFRHLLMVGHNPGISELVQFLTGEQHQLRPINVVTLHLSITQWSELAERCGTLQGVY